MFGSKIYSQALLHREFEHVRMARSRAPHGKGGKEESVVDWMRLLWPILPEVGEPGKESSQLFLSKVFFLVAPWRAACDTGH